MFDLPPAVITETQGGVACETAEAFEELIDWTKENPREGLPPEGCFNEKFFIPVDVAVVPLYWFDSGTDWRLMAEIIRPNGNTRYAVVATKPYPGEDA